jgi:hypothetical protein
LIFGETLAPKASHISAHEYRSGQDRRFSLKLDWTIIWLSSTQKSMKSKTSNTNRTSIEFFIAKSNLDPIMCLTNSGSFWVFGFFFFWYYILYYILLYLKLWISMKFVFKIMYGWFREFEIKFKKYVWECELNWKKYI